MSELYIIEGKIYKKIDDNYFQSIKGIKLNKTIIYSVYAIKVENKAIIERFEKDWTSYSVKRDITNEGLKLLKKYLERYSPFNVNFLEEKMELTYILKNGVDFLFNKMIYVNYEYYYMNAEYRKYINEQINETYER